ncbi:MAG TPA: HAMP domain-containing histidine kinase [Anaerolineae bacterium]|nr:HAMP domain-containing histidine kinase [Anaerolineae bacterium]
MIEPILTSKRKFGLAAVILLPFLLLGILWLFPTLDKNLWGPLWNTRLANYYLSMLAGFMALVAALFTAVTLSRSQTTRNIFLSYGFFSFGFLFLVSSASTPSIISESPSNLAFIWALYISYPLAGTFFVLSGIHWSPAKSRWIIERRHVLGISLFLVLTLFAFAAYAYSGILEALRPYGKISQIILSATAFLTLSWAAWRTHRSQWETDRRVARRLIVAMGLLATIQALFTWETFGYIGWLLYLPLTILALAFALSAILTRFKDANNVPLAYYFAALGSILIAALSLVSAELAWYLLTNGPGIHRTLLIPLSLLEGALSFLLLFAIVLYLNRLIVERTQALRREQGKRTELTQLIVHDLKSPLTVILSGMDLLSKESLGELTETQKRLLINLEQSGQGILRLINDLLDVERLEEGALFPNKTVINLTRLLENQVERFQVLAGTRNQTLSLIIDTSLPDIRVDKRLFNRVLDNLISNALKFAPEGGKVQVSAAADGESVDIWVADNGPGVPASEREKIFEKFAQIKGHERRGAGLGLTFCRMVAEAHKGTLTIEDGPLGGALFRISLPYDEVVVVDEGLTLEEVSHLRLEAAQ